jgi:hypothetical protein
MDHFIGSSVVAYTLKALGFAAAILLGMLARYLWSRLGHSVRAAFCGVIGCGWRYLGQIERGQNVEQWEHCSVCRTCRCYVIENCLPPDTQSLDVLHAWIKTQAQRSTRSAVA